MYQDLSKYENYIPLKVGDELSSLDPRLQIFSDEKIDVWYAPLGERQEQPDVWVLGITPGWQQMKIAYDEAGRLLQAGASSADAASAKKPAIAFAGTMRKNLISMLDTLGLAQHMGVNSTADLFGSGRLRTGSVLRYPVFNKGSNYSGPSPKPLKHSALKRMIEEVLVEELKSVNNCLIIPLGTTVDHVLAHCVAENYVDHNRILSGFPHPSGGNGYRVRHFMHWNSNLIIGSKI